jgi:hypothetical protein
MALRRFPLRAVKALFLNRQHLAEPRTDNVTARRLVRFAEDVGGIQIDSINVLERAHYLAVWTRFGPYDRAWLDRLAYRRRLFFEYWAHAACLVPTSLLPGWRRAMLDYRVRHTGWAKFLRRNSKVLAQVKATIEAKGDLAASDFDEERRAGGGGWWRWGPARHALHHLWMTGTLTIHSRRHFHKRYDLLERSFPAVLERNPVSSKQFSRWHIERSLHAMGAATEKDLAWYLSFPRFAPGARKVALRDMVSDGEVQEIEVEGQSGRWLVLTRDLAALKRAGRVSPPSRGTTFLSPFDSLLWHRERVKRLFGFDYQIEVYTPGHKRVHGYYTLPVLHQGELIGRIDAKTHRGEGRLEVRHAHFEPWFAGGQTPPSGGERLDSAEAFEGVAEALGSLATFVGAGEVTLRRVTPNRLRAPLSRKISSAPAEE